MEPVFGSDPHGWPQSKGKNSFISASVLQVPHKKRSPHLFPDRIPDLETKPRHNNQNVMASSSCNLMEPRFPCLHVANFSTRWQCFTMNNEVPQGCLANTKGYLILATSTNHNLFCGCVGCVRFHLQGLAWCHSPPFVASIFL